MNKENTLKLLEAFPRLYRGIHNPMTETCMCWGFDCGDGWLQMIWDLSAAIEEEARKESRSEANWPEAEQVKEKYGTLRFYVRFTSDAIEKLVEAVEERSGSTCEVCGAPGETFDDGWVKTLCVLCRDSR